MAQIVNNCEKCCIVMKDSGIYKDVFKEHDPDSKLDEWINEQ